MGDSKRSRGSRVFCGLACSALAAFAILLTCAAARADATKTVSGKLHSVKGNLLTLKKAGLVGSSLIEIEMDEHTKVTGQVAQGLHAKIKYKEEATAGGKGEPRRIAIEISTEPDRATKQAKDAAGVTPPPKKDQP
jgi:hypothetical protein